MIKQQSFLSRIYVVAAGLGGIYQAVMTLITIPASLLTNELWWFSLFNLGSTIALFYSVHAIEKNRRIRNSQSFNKFNCDVFQSNENYEIKSPYEAKYIGIDTKHGTVLLISAFNNVFKGYNIKEVAGYECRGHHMTLKFNDINFPMFTIRFPNEGKCIGFGHKLDVLLSPSYQPAVNVGTAFNDFVRQKSLA
ncbi:hypothetical protein [Enterobacter asburiae]|uniref:hypothetical protein n=1 Tax=Enterobacter asburiae TaxID=61645 RepID=UPI003F54C184